MKYLSFSYLMFSFVLLLLSGDLMAQTSSDIAANKEVEATDEKEMQQKWTASLGTFQFQVVDSRTKPTIHISIIAEIEKARLEDKDVYLPYKEDIRIYIPSKHKISEKEFKKLELIKYVKSNN